MNIINSIPRHAPKCILATERAIELEQKPKCSSLADTVVLNMLDYGIVYIPVVDPGFLERGL